MFHPLSEEDLAKVTEKHLADLRGRLAEIPMTLSWDGGAVELLARQGFDERYGARPLRRLIRREVEDVLAGRMLAGELLPGDAVMLTAGEGKVTILRKEEKQEAAAFAAAQDVNEL